MNKTFILIAGLVLVILLASVLVLALTDTKPPKAFGASSSASQPAPAQAQPPPQYAPLGGETASTWGSTDTAEASTPGKDIFTAGEEAVTPKAAAIQQIVEGKVTYSAEGVPLIQPYLNNPDPEIRLEAIEAMKQLDAPEAAAALRQAAKTARNAEERAAMLEAAEFVELPSILDLRQQLNQQQ